MRIGLAACVVSVAALGLHDPGANAAPAPGAHAVIVFADETGAVPLPVNPGVIRSRAVRPATDGLASAQTIQLNLFDDISFTATRRHVDEDENGIVWEGTLDAVPGDVRLATFGGALAGTVSVGDDFYVVRPTADGRGLIEQLDRQVFPWAPTLGLEAGRDSSAEPSSDDGSVIDLMVVHTASAREATGSANGLRSVVRLGVAEANAALSAAGVTSRVRLVHVAEVGESQTADAVSRLIWLTEGSDGVLDEVPVLRDRYGADLVAFVVDDGEAPRECGAAWRLTHDAAWFAPFAYGVVERACVSPGAAFARGLLQNLGLAEGNPSDPQGNAVAAARWRQSLPPATGSNTISESSATAVSARAAAASLAVPPAFAVTNAGGRIASGQDYWAMDYGNPKDFADRTDLVHDGFEDANITGVTVLNGQVSFTTQSDAQITLIHPSAPGAYPGEGTGLKIPVPSSRYRVLTFKLTCGSGCPPPIAAQANITYYKGPAQTSSSTTTQPIILFPGTNIYTIDMGALTVSDLSANNNVGTWTNSVNGSTNVNGIRFNIPATPGVQVSLDWVTLTDPTASAAANVNWGAFAGSAKVQLFSDNAGALGTRIPFLRGLIDTTQGDLVDLTPVGSLSSINLNMLSPGAYWLRAVDSGNNPIASDQRILINNVPRLAILQPDVRGDESSDYSRLYRRAAGQPATLGSDTWDFSQASDFRIPYVSNPAEYGTASVVTNPITSLAGTLSGDWMRYTNTTATSAPHDTQFLPAMVPPIDATRYRHLTIRMLLDRPRDVGLGAVLRVHWSADNPVFNLNRLNTSDDIVVENGVVELHVDMNEIVLDPNSPGRTAWANTGHVKYFRIDPHEYPTATVAYFDYVLLTTNDKTADGRYAITWGSAAGGSATGAADGDGDAMTATVRLDPDTNRFNGNEITLATTTPNTGTFNFDAANFPSVGAGSYFVLVEVSDGRNTNYRYSTGQLDVAPIPALANIPMYRTYNPNADYHFFTTSLAEKNFAVAAGYHDESTPLPFLVPNGASGGATPIFRMYNSNNGRHYYTANGGERDILMGIGWLYEKEEGFIYAGPGVSGTSELYRLYNHNSGVHLYTINAGEKDAILAMFPGIWVQHTSVGWAFP